MFNLLFSSYLYLFIFLFFLYPSHASLQRTSVQSYGVPELLKKSGQKRQVFLLLSFLSHSSASFSPCLTSLAGQFSMKFLQVEYHSTTKISLQSRFVGLTSTCLMLLKGPLMVCGESKQFFYCLFFWILSFFLFLFFVNM